MTTAPLVLPPKVRAVVYAVLTILGLAVGAAQVGYAAANQSNPTWLTVALAVVPFLASGLGAVALTHTPKAEEVAYEPKHAAIPDEVALGPTGINAGDYE